MQFGFIKSKISHYKWVHEKFRVKARNFILDMWVWKHLIMYQGEVIKDGQGASVCV